MKIQEYVTRAFGRFIKKIMTFLSCYQVVTACEVFDDNTPPSGSGPFRFSCCVTQITEYRMYCSLG